MRLAWRNLLYDRLRFFVTIAGIAFSIVLMLFQGSLLMGLAGISTKLIEIASPDIWITARGVESFESSVSLPERDRQTALGVKGVSSVDRIVTGTAVWRSESGEQQTVFIIGADRGISPHFPLPYEGGAIIPESVLIDQSDRPLLEIDKTPTTVEISGARARVLKSIEGFGSIIGTPYVFTSYQDGVKYLNLGDETMLLLVKIADGANRETVRRQLQSRLPNVEVRTQTEFLQLARAFLLIKSGAGGSVFFAAILGFLVGFVIVSQSIYSTTIEKIDEFATLKAIGASNWYIRKIVLFQAASSGAIGSVAGLLIALPLIRAAKQAISWIYTPYWLLIVIMPITLLMCCLAAAFAIRRAVATEPGRVFRV